MMQYHKYIFISFVVFLYCTFYTVFSLNIEELKPINYEIDILKTPMKREEISSLVHVTSTFGQEYQCILPQLEEEDVLEKEAESEKNTDIAELLKPIKAGSCLLKGKDWWTYEFCFGHYIKQFHIEDGQIVGPVITLGFYDSDYDWNNETAQEKFKHVKQRYHSQFYVNGSKCDLTGQPRNAEVRLFCEEGAGDYIHRVDEPGTCSYIITIHTSRLCVHPQLKPPPSKKAQTIPCHPILNAEDYAIYLKKQSEKKQKAEQTIHKWLSDQQERLQDMENEKQQMPDDDQYSQENEETLKATETTKNVHTKDSSSQSQINEKDPVSVQTGDVVDEDVHDYLTTEPTSSVNDPPKTMHPTDKESDSDDDKLEISIRRLDSEPSDPNGKLYEMDFSQRKKLEKVVKEKLEKLGLDISGSREIEVKVITTGYFSEDEKDLDLLSDEEEFQFQNIIMGLLTGQQEVVQEAEKQRKLEESYKYVYEEDDEIHE